MAKAMYLFSEVFDLKPTTGLYCGSGVLEYWSIGVLEYWSIGVLECWSVGVLECWSVGVGVDRKPTSVYTPAHEHPSECARPA
jgi:hypothetical protein